MNLVIVPNRTALLLIDPLNDFMSEGGKLYGYGRDVIQRVDLIAHLTQLLAAARGAGMLVVFAPHHQHEPGEFDGWKQLNPTHQRVETLKPFQRGSWGAEFHPQLTPRAGEVTASAHWFQNAFMNTDLALQLQVRDIDHLLIVGMRTNTCVEASARHAAELGYRVTLVEDAVAAFRWEEQQATLIHNAPTFAHAVSSTEAVLAALRPGRSSGSEVQHDPKVQPTLNRSKLDAP
jgi:nicotinamidase-related amidase